MKKFLIFLVLVVGVSFFGFDNVDSVDATDLGRGEYYGSWWILTDDGGTDENENPDEGNIHKAGVYTKSKEYATWEEIKDGFKNVTNKLDSISISEKAIVEGYLESTNSPLGRFADLGVDPEMSVDSSFHNKPISETKFFLVREKNFRFDISYSPGGIDVRTYRLRYNLKGSDYYLYFMEMEDKVVMKPIVISSPATVKQEDVQADIIKDQLTIPPGFSGLNKIGETSIPKLIGRFIRIVIGVIGTIALLMFVYGGLLWMTSAGNAEKTKKAMDIILWSSLGVIVILASYAIVNFVFGLL